MPSVTSTNMAIFKFLALTALAVLLYAQVWHAPFIFDDEIVILRNPQLQDLHHGFESLRHIWQFQPPRFLTNLTFALNFHVHQANTFGYHLVNWLLHLWTAVSVWYFTRLVLRLRGPQPAAGSLGVDVAFWAALLFLAHPVNTEAVSYTNHRSSILVTLFYLWSLIFYIRARTSSQARQAGLYFGATAVLAAVALLCKESAVTLPLAWVLADYYLCQKRILKKIWLALAVVILAAGVLFDFNWKAIFFTPFYSQSHRGDLLNLPLYVLTQLRVCVVFLKLIFFPVNLNADYDFPMSHSLWEGPTFLAFAFLAGLIGAAVYVRKKYWALSFLVFWFFVSLLSHIVPARLNVISEHKLYLTLAVFIPVLVIWLYSVLSRRTFVITMAIVLGGFSYLTLERNKLWADPVLLWETTIRQSPQKPRPYINLGVAYFHAGRFEEALAAYQTVIRMAPEYPEPYLNTADIYTQRNELQKALEYTELAIVRQPRFDVSYLQKAYINERLKREDEAVKSYGQWLELHPQDVGVLSHQADLMFRLKDYRGALANYDRLIKLYPTRRFYENRDVIVEILKKNSK